MLEQLSSGYVMLGKDYFLGHVISG